LKTQKKTLNDEFPSEMWFRTGIHALQSLTATLHWRLLSSFTHRPIAALRQLCGSRAVIYLTNLVTRTIFNTKLQCYSAWLTF